MISIWCYYKSSNLSFFIKCCAFIELRMYLRGKIDYYVLLCWQKWTKKVEIGDPFIELTSVCGRLKQLEGIDKKQLFNHFLFVIRKIWKEEINLKTASSTRNLVKIHNTHVSKSFSVFLYAWFSIPGWIPDYPGLQTSFWWPFFLQIPLDQVLLLQLHIQHKQPRKVLKLH